MIRICMLLLIAGGASAQQPEDGHDLYQVFCASCHGAEARGDGPFAEILTMPPPDLTRLSAGNDGVFPTLAVTQQIDGRDPLLGHGGEMPVFGPIFDFESGALKTPAGQPILTSRSIVDLVAWLETIQTPG